MSISNIANPKSILAKLLAQENLFVEHRKVSTASFDPKNRILTLPTWKEMNSDLYDLLVGHEVGHAWYTPPVGWHNAIEEKGKGFKSFLNVVEDARIEKFIKNKYPGLRAPFYRAYKGLFDTNFFGVEEIDLDELPLIDRLNLHFKIGSFLNVPFDSNEYYFIDKMKLLETWDDVYNLALELYSFHKENPTKTEFDDLYTEAPSRFNEEGDSIDDEYEDDFGTKASLSNDEDPESITDRCFREKELSLLSDDMQPNVYVNLPKAVPSKFIIKYNDLFNQIDFSLWDNYESHIKNTPYYEDCQQNEFIQKELNLLNKSVLVQEYRDKNMKFIMYLVKEFELKRNAAQFMRASISKTGELDTNKVWSYKLKDDLFKRVTKLPNGKNHGMVMFVDWSGSMTDNLTNTLEQTLVLADFCKKVSIPFEVFAFSDTNAVRKMMVSLKPITEFNDFSKRDKDLGLSGRQFALLNILSSKMTKTEYRNAQIRLLQYAKLMDSGFRRSDNLSFGVRSFINQVRNSSIPSILSLGGTPLNETILVANYYVPDFKKLNKLDVVNTIILTDGEGVNTPYYIMGGKLVHFGGSKSNTYNLIIKDTESGLTTVSKPNEPITAALLRMLKIRSDTNLIGYYISNYSIRSTSVRLANEYGHNIDADEVSRQAKKFKHYCLENTGYDKYFVVQNKDMEIKDSTILVSTDASKREYLKAFLLNQKNKILNRVLLNKFVDQIA